MTSNFGNRTHPISGGVKHHNGVDLRLDTGDDVIAPAMGKIAFAGEKGGYGNTVIIEHAFGFKTLYAHLDRIYVTIGEIVGKEKVIAAGGNSGNSTGPHLHYEVLYDNVFAIFSLPIIWLYNGKQGIHNKFTKYMFYFFYPLHLLLIVAIYVSFMIYLISLIGKNYGN